MGSEMCIRDRKRTDLKYPRLPYGRVHPCLRHPESKSDRPIPRISHLDPEHLPYPRKPDQVRPLLQQEQSPKPLGLALKPLESLSLPQLIRKRLLKRRYVNLGKQKRKNSPPVEGLPLLAPDLRLPKLRRRLIKLKKLGT